MVLQHLVFACFQGGKRPFLTVRFFFKKYPSVEADSYGNEKLTRKWAKSVFYVFFNLMGTRMVQIRIAKSV